MLQTERGSTTKAKPGRFCKAARNIIWTLLLSARRMERAKSQFSLRRETPTRKSREEAAERTDGRRKLQVSPDRESVCEFFCTLPTLPSIPCPDTAITQRDARGQRRVEFARRPSCNRVPSSMARVGFNEHSRPDGNRTKRFSSAEKKNILRIVRNIFALFPSRDSP